jgi:hypothetical protein
MQTPLTREAWLTHFAVSDRSRGRATKTCHYPCKVFAAARLRTSHHTKFRASGADAAAPGRRRPHGIFRAMRASFGEVVRECMAGERAGNFVRSTRRRFRHDIDEYAVRERENRSLSGF